MIFRILGTILLGGGTLGAAAGWMTIRYLEARREQLKQRVQKVKASVPLNHPAAPWPVSSANDWLRDEISYGLRQIQKPPRPHPAANFQQQINDAFEQFKRQAERKAPDERDDP